MKTTANNYRGHRFPTEIISHGIWLYYRFSLSLRDVEELLAKRGITVTHETIRQWCRKFGPEDARTILSQASEGAGEHAVIRNLFNLGRHQLSSANYRLLRERSFKEWSVATAA